MTRCIQIIDSTVAFVGAPAHYQDPDGPGGIPVVLDGLFIVEEYSPTDRAAYIHEPQYGVSEQGVDDGPMYYINADEFDKQVFPKMYGRMLAQEREFEMAAEDGQF
jgi:hypothetical protein